MSPAPEPAQPAGAPDLGTAARPAPGSNGLPAADGVAAEVVAADVVADVVAADGAADGAPSQAAATDGLPEATGPAQPPRPRADAVAMWVAIVVPVLGIVATLAVRTWLTLAFVLLAPLVVVVYALGVWVFTRVLRRESLFRRELGRVPLRYHGYAWSWALAYVPATVAPYLGSDDGPGVWTAALVVFSAVTVGVLTGAVWSAYLRDRASLEAPPEH